MNPDDVAQSYNQLASRWAEHGLDWEMGWPPTGGLCKYPPRRGHALDVGCGSNGRFIEFFLQEGFTPEGVDVSPEMIRLARERHPGVSFHCADICAWGPDNTYDFISAWDCLWHLPLSAHVPVLQKLIHHLTPGGVFLFSCGGTDEAGSHENQFMGPVLPYSSLGIRGFLDAIHNENALCRHLEYDQWPEKHAFLIVQKC